MKLTPEDRKYWPANPDIILGLIRGIAEDAKVLDIGPDINPFPRADEFVDWNPKKDLPGPVHKVDLGSEPLPFADKSFDFIYCRHVLEDMHNPFGLIAEMSRVGKAGYIETPSALAEMGRGVDVGNPDYRGYHHHRFIVWKHGAELRFVTKYPVVELYAFDDEWIVQKLRAGWQFWNMCHLWKGEIRFKHMQNPVDYFMPTQYRDLLIEAMESV